MSEHLFVMGDADNIRKKMQGFLLSGDLEALRSLSASLTSHIMEVAALAGSRLKAEIVFCGGDELLLRVDSEAFSEAKIRELMRYFVERTGVTISFGVGRSTGEAFINLARAKAMGPGSLFPAEEAAISAERAAD